MFALYYAPHPALENFVETFCLIGHIFLPQDSLSPIYTYMPIHTRFLCFFLEDPIMVRKGKGPFERRARAIAGGPQVSPVTLNLGCNHLALVVALKPGGLYRLLGIPMYELLDKDFDATEILGKEIDDVIEQLLNESANEKKISIVQNFLLGKLQRLKPKHILDSVMLQLVRYKGNISMDRLASKACLSVRQLERQSLARLGISPKFFARIVRFSSAYKCKEKNPGLSWTEIAFKYHYYDQMHLIRDFHQFTGESPKAMREDNLLNSLKLYSLNF